MNILDRRFDKESDLVMRDVAGKSTIFLSSSADSSIRSLSRTQLQTRKERPGSGKKDRHMLMKN
jgi:hypothetical protein